MALQNSSASASEHVVDTSHSICTCRSQFVTGTVEAGVKYLVIVSAKLFNALTCAYIPQARSPVN